jgi:hypothetical protein
MAQETTLRHSRGGLYFDDFVVGRLYSIRNRFTSTAISVSRRPNGASRS